MNSISGLSSVLSETERKFLIDGAQQNIRDDGRSFDMPRSCRLTYPELGEGTIQAVDLTVHSGTKKVEVLAGISGAIRGASEPSLKVVVTLAPEACGNSRREIAQSQLAAELEAALKDTVDFAELIVDGGGGFAWKLVIEILVSHCDGSVLDHCSWTIRALLRKTMLPQILPFKKPINPDGQMASVKQEPAFDFDVNPDPLAGRTPPSFKDGPIWVTGGLLGNAVVFDMSEAEELASDCSGARAFRFEDAERGRPLLIRENWYLKPLIGEDRLTVADNWTRFAVKTIAALDEEGDERRGLSF